jgi:serine/threonine-protein kinase
VLMTARSRSSSAASAASGLSTQTWQRLEAVLEDFETAWRRGERPGIEAFLVQAEGQAERQALLIELVHEDLELRFQAGEPVGATAYLDRYPELRGEAGVAVDLIAAEFRLRQRQGDGSPAEFVARFPEYGPQLQARLSGPVRHDALSPRGNPGDTPSCPNADVTASRFPASAAAHPAVPWPRVAGYEILEELGCGGMGVVYKARHLALQRLVALKMLRADSQGLAEMEGRFREEAQLTGQLQHPGIPPVHEVGVLADGRPFLAMKLIQGRTLEDLLQERSAPTADLPRFLAIFEQVCQTLAYAHSRGVLHRDLKPANIMVGAFGEVQVMDWGLAKVLKQSGAADTEATVIRTARSEPVTPGQPGAQTQAGAVLGTLAYMAPEQARGEVDQLDQRCDVFGLGALLCVVLTGQPPYAGAAAELWFQAARGELGDALSRLKSSGAEAELVQLARVCLAPKKEDRPSDAGAVSQALGAYLTGVQERLQKAERERAAAQVRVVEERRRRRITLALAGALLLLASLAGVGTWWFQRVEAARAEQTARIEREVRQALGEGLALAEQGRRLSANPQEWERMAELGLSATKRAQGLLESGEAGGLISSDLSEQLRTLTVKLTRQAQQAARTRGMMKDLDRILEKQTESSAGEFYKAGALPLYAPAFRAYGIDVEALPEQEVAAAIAASPLKAKLLAALDDWSLVHPDRMARERLTRIAQAVEADPQAFGHRLREARLKGDTAALKRLAQEADVRLLPSTTLVHLAAALRLGNERMATAELLKRAYAQHPDDFWVNHDLAMALRFEHPQEQEQMVGHFRAALAARPSSVGMYLRLGSVLRKRGQVDEAIALYRKAIELDPTYSPSFNNLANTWKEKGDLPEAIKALREATRLDPRNAFSHLNLGMTLASAGQYAEASASLRRGLEKRAASSIPVPPPTVRMVEQFLPVVEKLPKLLQGQEQPASNAERLVVADFCFMQKKLNALAARFYADALAADQKIADNPKNGPRYNAACAAALAGCKQGNDADKLDDQERARWRQQALDWLRADLTWWDTELDSGNTDARAAVQKKMRHWQTDADLAGVRGKEGLAKLTVAEREKWQQLWADVAALLQRAERK